MPTWEVGSDVNGPTTASDDNLPTLPEKPELKAEDAPVHQEASVAVTIYLSGNADEVVKFLEDNGGSPRRSRLRAGVSSPARSPDVPHRPSHGFGRA